MRFDISLRSICGAPSYQYIDVEAVSDQDDEHTGMGPGLPRGTRLGGMTLLRHLSHAYDEDGFEDAQYRILAGESQALGEVAYHLRQYEPDMPERWGPGRATYNGFLVLDLMDVEPYARGQGIGAAMIDQMVALNAGLTLVIGLTAYAYEIKKENERSVMQRRITDWYQRHPKLYLDAPAPSTPHFLIGTLDGAEPDEVHHQIPDLDRLVSAHKAHRARMRKRAA